MTLKLTTRPAALGWQGIWLGKVRVGYLIPGKPGVTRWQLNVNSERYRGNPTGEGEERACKCMILDVLEAWLRGFGLPTALAIVEWEDVPPGTVTREQAADVKTRGLLDDSMSGAHEVLAAAKRHSDRKLYGDKK